MKRLINAMIILGLISVSPLFAAGPGQDGSSGVQTKAYGEAQKSQQKMQQKSQGGEGKMHQERHRELEKKQVGIETGKGPEQGKSGDDGQGKKWWKFWE